MVSSGQRAHSNLPNMKCMIHLGRNLFKVRPRPHIGENRPNKLADLKKNWNGLIVFLDWEYHAIQDVLIDDEPHMIPG